MLPSQPLPGYRTKIQTPRRRRLSHRQVRRIEGASLWLAMLMLLFVQPLFEDAGATERQVAEGTGEFHYLGDQGRVPAPVPGYQLVTPYTSSVATDRTPARPMEEGLEQAAVPSLMPAGGTHRRIGYPQTATPAPLLMLSGLLGLLLSGLIAAIRRRRV